MLLLTGSVVYGQGVQDRPSTGVTRRQLSASGFETGTNLAASLDQAPDHKTFQQLLHAAGLDKKARRKGQYTVFAPTDAAFSTLSTDFLSELLLPASKQRLIDFIAFHVVKGRITSDLLQDGEQLTNLTGDILVVHKKDNTITIRDGRGNVADVIQPDIRATNGVVYTINKVLRRAGNTVN
ncbi:fasciclin domain-containing protein [Nibrella viscosa]|uniref:Fasciclin domain-containing protein n=2 Tax=Nibrella viscosa TaxID=1084524 RepID=A0ABP8JWS2_9BACT